MKSNELKICFIQDFPSLLEGIFSLTEISKNQIKKHIDKKKLNKRVFQNQEVSIPIALLNYGKVNPIYLGPEISILFEDDNFLVLHKPAKIHCHPLRYDENDNILCYLNSIDSMDSKLLEVNKYSYDRGLFYRLDYETSGILYYAKKDEVQHMMRQRFQDIVKIKTYLAVVSGKTSKRDHLEHKLISYGEARRKVRVDDSGRLCGLEYNRLSYNSKLDMSLLEVKLKQGFRHQIRVQLQAIGHPILGDPLYGGREFSRMMLHCYQYVFEYKEIQYDFICEFYELEKLFTDLNS